MDKPLILAIALGVVLLLLLGIYIYAGIRLIEEAEERYDADPDSWVEPPRDFF
jgi:hypothetical protein